jgi:hypothetical protein
LLCIDSAHECEPALEIAGQGIGIRVGRQGLQRMQTIDSGLGFPSKAAIILSREVIMNQAFQYRSRWRCAKSGYPQCRRPRCR